jgi:hypothetical protein
VKQILEEQVRNKELPEENGRFELHYTPADTRERSITITLPNPHTALDNQPNHYMENGGRRSSSVNKILHF